MSRSLVQPVGQKRLTNVAVVRLKKLGMRFEIACFKNKVLSWRSGVEKDIDEVLQTQTVYSNVSKGVLANSKDLMDAFGTTDEKEICLLILNRGELQVAGKERETQFTAQFRDIAAIVMEKTVDSETGRPYTITMIEKFMHDVHFAVDPNRTPKKQALELIKDLQTRFRITRAHMRVQVSVSTDHQAKLQEELNSWHAKLESSQVADDTFTVVFRFEPGHFRACNKLVHEWNGRLNVLAVSARKGDEDSDNEQSPEENVEELTTRLADTRVTARDEGPSASRQQPTGKRCLTCDTVVGDSKDFRAHYKTDWHKHNLKRKLKGLHPLSLEEYPLDTSVNDPENDMDEYSRVSRK